MNFDNLWMVAVFFDSMYGCGCIGSLVIYIENQTTDKLDKALEQKIKEMH